MAIGLLTAGKERMDGRVDEWMIGRKSRRSRIRLRRLGLHPSIHPSTLPSSLPSLHNRVGISLTPMATFMLLPHPATPCPFVTGLSVVVERLQDGGLRCSYEVAGQVDRLDIPQLKSATRTDVVWRHTGFEIFLRTAGRTDYDEFNFSPSREWAAYRFEHYRTGMVELELAEPPVIDYRQEPDLLELHARIGASERP